MKLGDIVHKVGFKLINSNLLVLLLFGVLFFISQVSFARENCVGFYCPQDQTVLPGEYFKATSIAANDFQKVLEENAKGNKSKLGSFLSDIKNFVILISKESTGVILIDFHPNNFEDSPVKGGGASYKISSETFKILEKEYSM